VHIGPLAKTTSYHLSSQHSWLYSRALISKAVASTRDSPARQRKGGGGMLKQPLAAVVVY
jgi:hypothetical protein